MMFFFCTYFNSPEGTEYNDLIMGYTNNMRMIIEKNMFFWAKSKDVKSIWKIQWDLLWMEEILNQLIDGLSHYL